MFSTKKNQETLSQEEITILVTETVAKTIEEMLEKGTIPRVNKEFQVEILEETNMKNITPVVTEDNELVEVSNLASPTILPKEENISLVEYSYDIQKITDEIGKLSASFEMFSYKENINKELHEELQKHRSGLRKEFITPLLKHIIREYNRADRQYRFYLQKSKQSQQNELFGKLLNEFQILSFALLDLLNDYAVEMYEAKSGETFSGKIHKIVEIVETDDQNETDTVAECITCGFRDVENDRLLQAAEVKVYKKK